MQTLRKKFRTTKSTNNLEILKKQLIANIHIDKTKLIFITHDNNMKSIFYVNIN